MKRTRGRLPEPITKAMSGLTLSIGVSVAVFLLYGEKQHAVTLGVMTLIGSLGSVILACVRCWKRREHPRLDRCKPLLRKWDTMVKGWLSKTWCNLPQMARMFVVDVLFSAGVCALIYNISHDRKVSISVAATMGSMIAIGYTSKAIDDWRQRRREENQKAKALASKPHS